VTTETETETDLHDCDACGEQHERDDMVQVLDCRGSLALAQESCIETHGDYHSCEYLSRSERGAEYVHTDQLVTTESGDSASESYAQNNWYYSDSDEQWYVSYESSSEYAAEEEAQERENADMYEYDTDVIDLHGWPKQTPSDSLCFGVELEVESANGDQSELCAALGGKHGDGTYLLKSDGSLDCGAEMVTLPYTLEHHQARFDWAAKLKAAQAVGNSGSNTTNCGIHVHINRAAISALTLGKMLVFVNDPRNVEAIQGIAQRSNSSWCKFHAKKLTDGKARYGEDKYQALNVRGNTVEVRIFKGNLRPERVLKNLEFCHALVMYCRTASMQALNWQDFWQWLRAVPANRKQYAHLIDFAHAIMQTGEIQTDKDI
jgi:hypothetical protein